MQNKEIIVRKLSVLKVPFSLYEHPPVHSIEECLSLEYAKEDVTFCKNILLCNRQKTAYYLYVTCPHKPFRTAEVSKKLHSSRLSFADREDLPALLNVQSGALSPFALWLKKGGAVALAVDKDIFRPGRIAFHPCENTSTLIFAQQDFRERILPEIQFPYLLIE